MIFPFGFYVFFMRNSSLELSTEELSGILLLICVGGCGGSGGGRGGGLFGRDGEIFFFKGLIFAWWRGRLSVVSVFPFPTCTL